MFKVNLQTEGAEITFNEEVSRTEAEGLLARVEVTRVWRCNENSTARNISLLRLEGTPLKARRYPVIGLRVGRVGALARFAGVT